MTAQPPVGAPADRSGPGAGGGPGHAGGRGGQGGPSRCPRCGASFACGVGGPGPCPCTGPPLSAAQRAALATQFSGCLCLACLQAVAAGAALTLTAQPD